MPENYLEIREPEGARRVEVTGGGLVIGRGEGSGAVLSDTLASRKHCAVEPSDGGKWRVRDLGSRNGTLVNGHRVEEVTLTVGDVITVGTTEIVFIGTGGGVIAGGFDVVDDDGDVLGAEDVVEVAEAPAAPVRPARGLSGVPGAMVSGEADPEARLEAIAGALPDGGLREADIALVNSRGQVVHGAGKQRVAGAKREANDLFRLLLLVCFRSRATDIHLEPRQDCYGVRLRVDGVMVDVAKVPSQFGVRLATLVKVLSDLDIAQRNALQEGHFTSRVGGRRVDYRVSFAPSVFGQKLVVRILDAEYAPLKLPDLKLPTWMEGVLDEQLTLDAGMVIAAGPTGSGKTTTLYALLRTIELDQRNAVTIEDPVEMQIEGTTQMPVDEGGGKSFSAILRSVLRQDPDVIMVGEIRDTETARTAMQAAVTGHMVLSTIHTKDALGTVYRLLDLGVEPYLVSQGLHVVVAQRLVRVLCPACKRRVEATEKQRKVLEQSGLPGVEAVCEAVGCPRCLGTGHMGRRAVFELLKTTDALRSKIQAKASLEELRSAVDGANFSSLGSNAMRLVADGAAAFDEVEKIAFRA